MPSVPVSELKAQLSRYLRAVRRGTEFEILDHGVPVARLVAVTPVTGADTSRWRRLVKAGVLRPGGGNAAALLRRAPLRLDADLGGALRSDREDEG